MPLWLQEEVAGVRFLKPSPSTACWAISQKPNPGPPWAPAPPPAQGCPILLAVTGSWAAAPHRQHRGSLPAPGSGDSGGPEGRAHLFPCPSTLWRGVPCGTQRPLEVATPAAVCSPLHLQPALRGHRPALSPCVPGPARCCPRPRGLGGSGQLEDRATQGPFPLGPVLCSTLAWVPSMAMVAVTDQQVSPCGPPPGRRGGKAPAHQPRSP